MTTTICFAVDQILVHRSRSDVAVLQDVFRAHDIEPTELLVETAADAFRRAFDDIEPSPHRQSMQAVIDAAGTDADSDAMVETLRDLTYEATTVPDGARTSIDDLAAENQLGVVTNGVRSWQHGKLTHHEFSDPFDVVVASYDVGAHTPDTAVFGSVQEQLPADEYAMVGTSGADIEGARAAGFAPIRYESAGPNFWDTVGALL
jgi:putative hydrolase of the HAD superfamily